MDARADGQAEGIAASMPRTLSVEPDAVDEIPMGPDETRDLLPDERQAASSDVGSTFSASDISWLPVVLIATVCLALIVVLVAAKCARTGRSGAIKTTREP